MLPGLAPSGTSFPRFRHAGGLVANEIRSQYYLRSHPRYVRIAGVKLDLSGVPLTPVLRESLYAGWYETEERSVLTETLRGDDVCLELGGGIGLITTIAAQRVRSVTVCEANPALTPIISRTLESNNATATVINGVVTNEDGEVDFFIAPGFWESSLTPVAGAERRKIRAVSFDRLLQETNPTYLICDIEGAEVDVLGNRSLPSVRAICLETHPESAGIEATQHLLAHLINDGFALDLRRSVADVAFFYRPGL
jgi:FkbM family methyltransferase